MKKYIKVNNNHEIVDVFFDYQKSKFDGTEIFLEDVSLKEHKINGESISNYCGVFKFTWFGQFVFAKTPVEMGGSVVEVNKYKRQKRDELFEIINGSLFKVLLTRDLDEIKTQWDALVATSANWKTLSEVDTAFHNALSWLGL